MQQNIAKINSGTDMPKIWLFCMQDNGLQKLFVSKKIQSFGEMLMDEHIYKLGNFSKLYQ